MVSKSQRPSIRTSPANYSALHKNIMYKLQRAASENNYKLQRAAVSTIMANVQRAASENTLQITESCISK